MAKQGRKKNPEAVLQRKLADAQEKLRSAQENRDRVIAEEEQKVEGARQQAAERVQQATEQVERRATKVARAESRLLEHVTDARALPSAVTPVIAAERLQSIVEESSDDNSSAVLTPDSPPTSDDLQSPQLTSAEWKVLASLRDGFGPEGATYTQWMGAAQMSKRTFLRARGSLVDRNLVTRDGTGQGARYVLADSAKVALQAQSP